MSYKSTGCCCHALGKNERNGYQSNLASGKEHAHCKEHVKCNVVIF